MTEPTSKALKVGGAWAGAATLVAAIAAGIVQMRPVLNDLALAESGKVELEEIRRHAIDQPIRYELVQTTRGGLVALSVFETGCVRVASANRLKSLPAPEHEAVETADAGAAHSDLAYAGAMGAAPAGAPCTEPPDGQCAIPADHPTWAWQEVMGRDAGGWVLLHLLFEDGDRLEARFNPATGEFLFGRWLCCVH